jgi:hypothetical protein
LDIFSFALSAAFPAPCEARSSFVAGRARRGQRYIVDFDCCIFILDNLNRDFIEQHLVGDRCRRPQYHAGKQE